jgi:hypothetical protein
MSLRLESIVAEARQKGWAVGRGSLESLRSQISTIKAVEVPLRQGEPPISLLKPVTEEMAQPNSLSAKYGTGPQPLHTDGAHLSKPPDIVILACEGISAVSTKLWRNSDPFVRFPPHYVQHGIFAVLAGRNSFYAPAYSNRLFRFDPGCMVPCDKRARQAVGYFELALSEATEHQWSEPDLVLAIDNRKSLHARSAAESEPDREIKRLALHLPEVTR